MEGLGVGLLGPVQLTVDGVEIPVGRPQVRRMLVILGLHPGRVVPTDVLVESLWDEPLPLDPHHALHVYVNRVRQLAPAMAAAVRTEPLGYVMDVPAEAIDVHRFETGAEVGHRSLDSDPPAARERLVEALALWRGSAFGIFRYADFVAYASRRLEEQRLSALEDLCDADIRLGEARRAVPTLHELVSENPFRERLVELLMRALDADGRRIEALAAFRTHCAVLERELGAEPSIGVQAIAYDVLRGDLAGATSSRDVGAVGSLHRAAR